MKRSNKSDALCIAVDEIDQSGYHLSCTKPTGWVADSLREWKTGDCGFDQEIRIQLDCFKTGGMILVRGSIATTVLLRCVRCLEDFSRPFAATFHYNMLPEQEGDLPQEMEIPREEFDAYYYRGAVLDLAPLVLEQIVLHIPVNPLCQDSCKGICQQCGADLNRTPCSCAAAEEETTRFAALMNFSPKSKT